MNRRQVCKVATYFLALVVLVNVANAQSKDRDSPTQLTSNEISGLIDSESKGNFYYYTFTANPGELTITLSVESNPPLNNTSSGLETLNAVSFTLFDRNAVAIADKKAAASYGQGTGQAIAHVEITRRQSLVIGINIQNPMYQSSSGKYRLRISGVAEFSQKESTGGISGYDKTTQRAPAIKECLPKQGTLIIKMKDGSKKIIDLSEAETITVVP